MKQIPVREFCKEWIDNNRCNNVAVVIFWGKLFEPEALGPRCLDCAEKHLPYGMENSLKEGWAIFDLRNLVRNP